MTHRKASPVNLKHHEQLEVIAKLDLAMACRSLRKAVGSRKDWTLLGVGGHGCAWASGDLVVKITDDISEAYLYREYAGSPGLPEVRGVFVLGYRTFMKKGAFGPAYKAETWSHIGIVRARIEEPDPSLESEVARFIQDSGSRRARRWLSVPEFAGVAELALDVQSNEESLFDLAFWNFGAYRGRLVIYDAGAGDRDTGDVGFHAVACNGKEVSLYGQAPGFGWT